MPKCSYCGTTDLVYELHPNGGTAYRCIECLAIERGQDKVRMPFEVWLERDDIEPPAGEDTPDFEPFDPRKDDYECVRAWFRILGRLKEDKPIIQRDPDAIGAVCETVREFLTNVMGADAHKRPSELRGSHD